jgi:hypothetical protein
LACIAGLSGSELKSVLAAPVVEGEEVMGRLSALGRFRPADGRRETLFGAGSGLPQPAPMTSQIGLQPISDKREQLSD